MEVVRGPRKRSKTAEIAKLRSTTPMSSTYTEAQTIRPTKPRGYEIVVWTNKYQELTEMR
jgi:hypothetical protein